MKLSTFIKNVVNTNKIIEINTQNLSELFQLTLAENIITNILIKPQKNCIFKYEIAGNETFQFQTPDLNETLSFRLYLIMPNDSLSITLPSNIKWEEEPDFSQINSLYMFVFEWNPIINKWLGNLMWEPINLEEEL